MPLGHRSTSHGILPFGFFNIETDLLLLDRLFFFAHDFCSWVEKWADDPRDRHETRSVWVISDPGRRGNLMGAIHGVDLSGFIGRVYRLYPFPERSRHQEKAFKQNPEGERTRPVIEALVTEWAGDPEPVCVTVGHSTGEFVFGSYAFDAPCFAALLRYVEEGGMPGWTDATPPPYVLRMIDAAARSPAGLFSEVHGRAAG